MRFKIGWNDISSRPLGPGDGAVAVMSTYGKSEMLSSGGFFRVQLDDARSSGARNGFIFLGRDMAHVAQPKAVPEQPPDATIAVPPRNPRAMGQLVHRLPVGPRSIDLATYYLETVC